MVGKYLFSKYLVGKFSQSATVFLIEFLFLLRSSKNLFLFAKIQQNPCSSKNGASVTCKNLLTKRQFYVKKTNRTVFSF